VAGIPPAEVHIDSTLVRRLLAAQCPHLADEHVQSFAHGWDNEMFAVGPHLLARLPRRQEAAALIAHEVLALPRLAPRLPVPVPVPVFTGRPQDGYPWSWTVVSRLPGHRAVDDPVPGRVAAVEGLAGFLVALHTTAEADAPANPFRGVPLIARRVSWAPRIAAVAGAGALAGWQRAAAAPVWPQRPVWLHGDLHPLNVLLHADGGLAGVIDFGDVCAGDPASDLAVAWLMFDAPARRRFRASCNLSGAYDQAIWTRAWAWALGLACVFSQASDDMPALAAIARHGLAETLVDPPEGVT
jgi:aminoglycoside phosphotransferase (APT) family kinase protein